MTDIDWSKAPADATHCDPETGLFYKKDDAEIWLLWIRKTAGWVKSGSMEPGGDSDPSLMIARTSAWNGEGMPPIGITCEFNRAGLSSGAGWKPVMVFAHKTNTNGSTSVLFDYIGVSEWGACATPNCFRPMRNPEQISAEKRRMIIAEILTDMDSDPIKGIDPIYAERLYEAGWRKVKS